MDNLKMTTLLMLASLTSCAGLRDHVESAADKRDVVCGLAMNTLAGDPAVDKVRALCEADAPLREIAAAYAGCGK